MLTLGINIDDLDTQELEPKKVVNPDLIEKSSEQGFYDALAD